MRSGRAPRLDSFWLLQAIGWGAFAVAMMGSRMGRFPLTYMIAAKGTLAVIGLVLSLGLRAVYRPLVRRGVALGTLLVVCVVASYAAALLWAAADNVVHVPIARAILGRGAMPGTVGELFSGAVYYAFAMLAWSLLYVGVKHHQALEAERERSLRAEALAHQARLDALRYQLNPHFLFNTLNAISTLVVEHRNAEAGRMIARLADLLRATLERPDADDVPLADEIELVRRYLEIEEIRFGDRLTTRIDVADDAWPARVPALLLQPLVENAIRHAVAPREAGGRVVVSARRAGDVLRLAVRDDGPGLGAAAAEGTGVGLANTRARLAQLYGDRHAFELASPGDGGLEVRVAIPMDMRPATHGPTAPGRQAPPEVVKPHPASRIPH